MDRVNFQALLEELGIYLLSFDRAGYGESDPHPKMTEKSTALDIEELADKLELGSKFYIIGFSMGGEIGWTCLKFIPHRYEPEIFTSFRRIFILNLNEFYSLMCSIAFYIRIHELLLLLDLFFC